MSDTEKSGGAARGCSEPPWYINGFWCNGVPVRHDPSRPFEAVIHGEPPTLTDEWLKAQLPPGAWHEKASETSAAEPPSEK